VFGCLRTGYDLKWCTCSQTRSRRRRSTSVAFSFSKLLSVFFILSINFVLEALSSQLSSIHQILSNGCILFASISKAFFLIADSHFKEFILSENNAMISALFYLFYLIECYSNYESYNIDPCNLPRLPKHHNDSQMVRQSGILFIKRIPGFDEDSFILKVISKYDFRGFMLLATSQGIFFQKQQINKCRRANWHI